jgi:hypothetical protein
LDTQRACNDPLDREWGGRQDPHCQDGKQPMLAQYRTHVIQLFAGQTLHRLMR